MKKIYLILAIIGTIVPYYFVITFLIINGIDLPGFYNGIFETLPGANFASDLVISIIIFLIFLYHNIKKYKIMPNIWVFVFLTSFVGLSCSLPLFLYYRERSLEK